MKKPKKRKDRTPAMVFEHATVERQPSQAARHPYDRIAARVLAAVEELNKALVEAHECAEMRVFLGASKADGGAMRFQPQIYNLTHSTLTYRIKVNDDGSVIPTDEKAWRQVKDPAFKDATGQAFDALLKVGDGMGKR